VCKIHEVRAVRQAALRNIDAVLLAASDEELSGLGTELRVIPFPLVLHEERKCIGAGKVSLGCKLT
jgi:hypothetical protein